MQFNHALGACSAGLCAHAAGKARTQFIICKQLNALSFEQSGNNRRRELVADSVIVEYKRCWRTLCFHVCAKVAESLMCCQMQFFSVILNWEICGLYCCGLCVECVLNTDFETRSFVLVRLDSSIIRAPWGFSVYFHTYLHVAAFTRAAKWMENISLYF